MCELKRIEKIKGGEKIDIWIDYQTCFNTFRYIVILVNVQYSNFWLIVKLEVFLMLLRVHSYDYGVYY